MATIASVGELSTPRLMLRQWRESDLAPFAALNAHPEVMRYFPAPLTREASDESAAEIQATLARQGWGLWAVEVPGGAPFIGFVGLNRVGVEAHFTPHWHACLSSRGFQRPPQAPKRVRASVHTLPCRMPRASPTAEPRA